MCRFWRTLLKADFGFPISSSQKSKNDCNFEIDKQKNFSLTLSSRCNTATDSRLHIINSLKVRYFFLLGC